MKGKSCETNMNTVLCVFLGILLLIVLWYVVFGKKTVESFRTARHVDGAEGNAYLTGNGTGAVNMDNGGGAVKTQNEYVAVDNTGTVHTSYDDDDTDSVYYVYGVNGNALVTENGAVARTQNGNVYTATY